MFLCQAPAAFAGAWTLEPKSRQIISSVIIDRSDRLLGPDIGGFDQDPNFNKFESGFYLEQGLTPRVTFIAQSAFQTVSFNNGVEQVSFNGFSNNSLGLRYGVLKSDNQAVSVELHGVINGGGEDVPDGDLGRGGVSLELRGLYGRNFKLRQKNGFAEIQVGGRSRLNEDPVEIRVDGTVGLHLNEKLLILSQGFYMQNAGTLRDPLDPVFATRSLKGQLSLVYWLKPRYGVQVGAFRTLLGRNVVDEEALIFGIWQRF